jgi:membrane protein
VREGHEVKIPGLGLLKRAERTGNEVEVPMTRNLGTVEMLKRTFREASEDHLAAFAGNLTYKGLFALFPLFVFLLSLLGLFASPDSIQTLLDSISAAMPESAATFLREQLVSIASSQAESAFTIGAIVSIAAALWGVSGAFRSVMEAMNVMYEVEEARPFWKVYGISIFLSLGIALLLLSALALLVFGYDIAEAVASYVGLSAIFTFTWKVVQWPLLLVFVLLAFALVYYFAPDVEQRFRWISPGSIVAVVMWLLFSFAFSAYVNFSDLGATYGSLAGVAILMLYLYYTAYIVLLGAEMNQVIEEDIPGGKNEGEKTTNE